MLYAFGNYQLDDRTSELRRGDILCRLEPRVFAVLMYLVKNRDHIVSRDELIENLWPGQMVSEAVLNNCIMTARKAIGDSGEGQQIIRTHYGQGYRFVAEVKESLSDPGLRDMAMSVNTPLFVEPSCAEAASPPTPSTPLHDDSCASQNVLSGDYRFVSVLCGALEHTAAPLESADGEAAQHLRRMFFTWAQVEAEQRGGAFHYFGADGVLMVFGLPAAQKDHALRAVLAGLKLQERLHERSLALNSQPTVEAAVRLGLHSGPIKLCCMTDDLASSSLTSADVATLAIRLHYLAKAGQLLTSMATVPLIEEIVEMVAYGAVRMPGHADSMMAYRICRLIS